MEKPRGMARAIVDEAREWIGTPFHHQGRRCSREDMKGGVDCLGLVIGVSRTLKLEGQDACSGRRILLAEQDVRHYGHRPDTATLFAALERWLQPVTKDRIQAGDIVLCEIDGRAQHLAIVSDYDARHAGLIHAYAPYRKVVEHRLNSEWEKRIVYAFRVKEMI